MSSPSSILNVVGCPKCQAYAIRRPDSGPNNNVTNRRWSDGYWDSPFLYISLLHQCYQCNYIYRPREATKIGTMDMYGVHDFDPFDEEYNLEERINERLKEYPEEWANAPDETELDEKKYIEAADKGLARSKSEEKEFRLRGWWNTNSQNRWAINVLHEDISWIPSEFELKTYLEQLTEYNRSIDEAFEKTSAEETTETMDTILEDLIADALKEQDLEDKESMMRQWDEVEDSANTGKLLHCMMQVGRPQVPEVIMEVFERNDFSNEDVQKEISDTKKIHSKAAEIVKNFLFDGIERANLERLIKLFDISVPEEFLLKAEALRELEKFEESISLIHSFDIDSFGAAETEPKMVDFLQFNAAETRPEIIDFLEIIADHCRHKKNIVISFDLHIDDDEL